MEEYAAHPGIEDCFTIIGIEDYVVHLGFDDIQTGFLRQLLLLVPVVEVGVGADASVLREMIVILNT